MTLGKVNEGGRLESVYGEIGSMGPLYSANSELVTRFGQCPLSSRSAKRRYWRASACIQTPLAPANRNPAASYRPERDGTKAAEREKSSPSPASARGTIYLCEETPARASGALCKLVRRNYPADSSFPPNRHPSEDRSPSACPRSSGKSHEGSRKNQATIPAGEKRP